MKIKAKHRRIAIMFGLMLLMLIIGVSISIMRHWYTFKWHDLALWGIVMLSLYNLALLLGNMKK